jgi:hypothetical protein
VRAISRQQKFFHGEPGTRLPHAWVQRDGERVSTLDLHGGGLLRLITGWDGRRGSAPPGSVSCRKLSRSTFTATDPKKRYNTLMDGGHNSLGYRLTRRCWYVPMTGKLTRCPDRPPIELRKVIRQILARD